ncbi:MAG TPA: AAA family ATPase [Candidatus Sulfotelmatobacter sp.]|nr:AAA family ATPase [Candidatus Sulfotelmatobacter sp.]HWI58804.1 AAA family ATPase [Bacillota bacterium]
MQILDRVKLEMITHGMSPSMPLLRQRLVEMEELQEQAQIALEKLNEAVEKLRAPALRLGTLLQRLANGRALVCVNGTDFVCNLDPAVSEDALETGTRVLLNEAFAVTDAFGFDRNGPVVRITELLSDGRLRVGNETGISDAVVARSSLLMKEKLKTGVDVRLDSQQRVAVEIIGTTKRQDRTFTQVEPIPWSAIGGQQEAVEGIRDCIELPFLHARLFRRFQHPVPKGFLLYGPPGCGKTLLGKAAAHNLRLQIRHETGEDRPEFFLSVKGPEILNMWLGESERQVRDLFAQCREKAAEGQLAFLFIDEAESILGTRHAHRVGSNILSTLVPMFCTEMDGLEPLQNVVVILASNRADLIDPAILRPGRIDRKIRVRRPNKAAAQEIYRIYLTEELPLATPRETLVEAIVEAHYAQSEENRFLDVTFRSGRHDYLYRGDLASGAIIAAIVERAKELAIKRSIEARAESPITFEDLFIALTKEYQENELFPPSDITEDWLKLTDFDPGNVVRLGPYRVTETNRQFSGAV